MFEIRPATDMDLARALFREYQREIGIDLCFQSFEAELAGLPGQYAAPAGALLILWRGAEAAGCVALRPSAAGIGEMKRLYVRPAARGAGAGRLLAEAAIAAARERGYHTLRLDTLPAMEAAIGLYRGLGFVPVERYYEAAPADGLFFAKAL